MAAKLKSGASWLSTVEEMSRLRVIAAILVRMALSPLVATVSNRHSCEPACPWDETPAAFVISLVLPAT
jgi:hypothetical protein